MKKTVIITSYIENSLNLNKQINANDFIICTDGGYDIAIKNNIIPDVLMGDFDSIEAPLPDNIKIIRFKPEKDFTDLDLALKFSMENNSKNIKILGGIGGRLDHTVANLQLLSYYCDFFDTLVMMDGRNKCFVLKGNHDKKLIIPSENDSYLSLFSLSENCTGVTIQNVKYPLENHTLTNTFPLGVSNEFKEKDAVLSVENGTLLVIIAKR